MGTKGTYTRRQWTMMHVKWHFELGHGLTPA